MGNSKLFLALQLCLFYQQVIASFDLSDLENGVYHRIDITRTPIKIEFNNDVREEIINDLDTVELSSVYGQLYSCSYKSPSAVLANISTEPEKPWLHVNVTEMMQSYFNGTRDCLKATKGWWTYEICPWKHVIQYHDDRETRQSSGRSTLGLYAHEFNWTNSSEGDLEVKKKYHSQHFENGAVCDLTQKPRQADIQYVCFKNEDTEDGIVDIQEPQTCHYVIQVHIHKLCQSTVFRRSKMGHILVGITCNPALSEEKLKKYQEITEKRKPKQPASIKVEIQDVMSERGASEPQTVATLEKELLKAFEKMSGNAAASSQMKTAADETEDKDLTSTFESEMAKVDSLRVAESEKLRADMTEQFEAIIEEAEKELLRAENEAELHPDQEKPAIDREKALETLAETMDKIVDKVQHGDPRVSAESLNSDGTKSDSPADASQEATAASAVEIEYEADPLDKDGLSEAIRNELEKAGIKPGEQHVEIRIINGASFGAKKAKKAGSDGQLPENSGQTLGKMIAAVLTSDASVIRSAIDQQNLEDNYSLNFDEELEAAEATESTNEQSPQQSSQNDTPSHDPNEAPSLSNP